RNPATACLLAGCVALLAVLMAVLLHDTDVAHEKAKDAGELARAENRRRQDAESAKQAAEDQMGIATAETQAIRRAATEKNLRQYAVAMHHLEDTVSAGQVQRARETMSNLAKINSALDNELLGDPRGFEWGYYSNLVSIWK